MAVQERLYTAKELWNRPDDGKIYELHNGVLIEVAGSARKQTKTGMWLGFLIGTFIMERDLGGEVSGADGTYVLGPFNTRIPDVAYISEATAQRQPDTGFYMGAPDLAIEVVSPSNTPEDMQQRAGEYIQAGSRLVWIIDPQQQTVDVYHADGQRRVLKIDDTLDGGDVLPGLTLPVEKIFSPFKK